MTRKRVTDCIPSYAKESKEHFLQTFQLQADNLSDKEEC